MEPNRPDDRGSDERGIDERFIDDAERGGQQEIEAAAEEEFVRDQRDPDHPTRRRRESEVDDPSHSKGI